VQGTCQVFFLGQLSVHNSKNKEISGEAVGHNTECSPQIHALTNSYHIEIRHSWLAISFDLLNF